MLSLCTKFCPPFKGGTQEVIVEFLFFNLDILMQNFPINLPYTPPCKRRGEFLLKGIMLFFLKLLIPFYYILSLCTMFCPPFKGGPQEVIVEFLFFNLDILMQNFPITPALPCKRRGEFLLKNFD